MNKKYELIIIGGGAAGMAAAAAAHRRGVQSILLIDKEERLGGKLVGAHYEIDRMQKRSGESYRNELLIGLSGAEVEIKLSTTALKIEDQHIVACIRDRRGIERLQADHIILATGAREQGRDPQQVVGDNVSGIYTAGVARKVLKQPSGSLGKKILIVGSTELERVITLIKTEGCEVVGIAADKREVMAAYGLETQCYEGYELMAVHGKERVGEAVLMKGREELTVPCDTIILAYPLVCEAALAMKSGIQVNEKLEPVVSDTYETSMKGVYACGRGVKADQSIEAVLSSAEQAVEAIAMVRSS